MSALRSLKVDVDAIAELLFRSPRSAPLRSSCSHLDDISALLSAERSLDALIVCSPPSFHGNGILSGIRSGIHVLCEKPLTLDRRYSPRSKRNRFAERVRVLDRQLGLFTSMEPGFSGWPPAALDLFAMLIFACFARVRQFRLRRTIGAKTRRSRAAASSWITAGTISI